MRVMIPSPVGAARWSAGIAAAVGSGVAAGLATAVVIWCAVLFSLGAVAWATLVDVVVRLWSGLRWAFRRWHTSRRADEGTTWADVGLIAILTTIAGLVLADEFVSPLASRTKARLQRLQAHMRWRWL
ncbi:hypothetical protein [Rhodoplanes roseus]|uniref:Uncharacterized protein n=1 Tax=Rhodoplanes roseus TaxID=29409 RepID=A0A327KZK5_9BRAD|nr:hypothetical protein [Rhodoplanes roseus]RAI42652.1 hypothetical protein CH341_18505 [Rhodoplanes roseus]